MSCEPSSSHGRLYRDHVLSPVTALAFYAAEDGQLYILAGEDTDIKIYDVETARLCGQLPVFRAQSVHGVAVPPRTATTTARDPSQILVWGGHSVTVLSSNLIENAISSSGDSPTAEVVSSAAVEAKAPDWIFDGRISPFGDDRVVLLTAHNELIEARMTSEAEGRRVITFGAIRSPSRPILFSGNLSWVSEDRVLVAAGTVFGEILVWKCRIGVREHATTTITTTTTAAADCEVLFVFSGHEGSIFGVHISPEMRTASGETMRLLASCSDDRTIRVWDITENSEGSRGYDSRISDARQTGFGDSVEALPSEEDRSTSRCLAVMMGHLSRIWQVEFPQEQRLFPELGIMEIYSFGEDATAQKWHLCFDAQQLQPATPAVGSTQGYFKPSAKLIHQLTSTNHSGKHIWSHAIHTGEGKILIATGGSDGKIALLQNPSATSPLTDTANQAEHPIARTHANQMVSLTLEDVSRACPSGGTVGDVLDGISHSKKPKNAREIFQSYTFITESRILVVTNFSRVFVGTFGDELTWAQLPLPEEMAQAPLSYSVLENSRPNSLAFIGTTTGDVYYYDDASASPSLEPLVKVHGKVAGIFSLSDAASPVSGPPQSPPLSPSNGDPMRLPVELLIAVLGSTRAVVIQVNSHMSPRQIEVTLEQGFIVTAAILYRGYLLLGSRNGIICVLSRNVDGGYSPKSTVQVKFDDAITSIVPLPSRDHWGPGYFLATCRDAKYRIYELRTADSAVRVDLLHEVAPRFGSVIEGAWFCDSGDGGRDLMLCGFRGKNMVLWNETKQQGVASVDCGGGHRSFACTPLRNNPDGFRFAFTKVSQMHVFSQAAAPQRTLKPGGHGREIKAASASSGSGRYIATGAEDTAIRIWEYSRNTSDKLERNLRCVAVLEKHATGIQTLRWHGDEYLFSSAGFEEFYVWRVNRIDSDVCPLGVVCEAVFPDRTEGGDLRIMDFDVEPISGQQRYEQDRSRGATFHISMALSNSTLQSYTYARGEGFKLAGRRSYTGACLTQLRHLGSATTTAASERGSLSVLTAATDGHLAIFGSITSPAAPTPIDQNEEAVQREAEAEADAEAGDVLVTKLHQNSIKSLDVRRAELEDGAGPAYLVVTGGDDNALGVTAISSRGAGYEVRSKSIVRSAHAAAVTGVAILRLAGGGGGGRDAIIASAGSDQRVKTWRIEGWQSAVAAPGRLKIALLDDRYSAVADSGDLEVVGEDRLTVVGVGMEVWRVP